MGEEDKMTVSIKPITATVEVNEEKYVKAIIKSLQRKPSEKAKERNLKSLSILRRAKRG